MAALAALCLAGAHHEDPDPSAAPARALARITAPQLASEPASGKGRLMINFSGNRRWCTFPDDRPVKPPEDPRKPILPGHRNEVFTFGYQFSVAAVERGAPARPLMLYESPIFRTAQMVPAAKIGGPPGPRKLIVGPSIGAQPRSERGKPLETGASLVPSWQDEARCVTLPEHFDFDLDPGTYDLYVAFDLMGREGGWGHRMNDFLTDVPVEAGRVTRLDGLVNMPGGVERQLSLDRATLMPPAPDLGASSR